MSIYIPEWVAWILLALLILHIVVGVLELYIIHLMDRLRQEEEANANLLLISRAPKMFKLLQDLADNPLFQHHCQEYQTRLEALLEGLEEK
jgi:ABC-type enterochelin transport system permease subunit